MKPATITRKINGERTKVGRVCIKTGGTPMKVYGDLDYLKSIYSEMCNSEDNYAYHWFNTTSENPWKVYIFKSNDTQIQDSLLPYDYAQVFREGLNIHLEDYVILERLIGRRADTLGGSRSAIEHPHYTDILRDFNEVYGLLGDKSAVKDYILVPYAYAKVVPKEVSMDGEKHFAVDVEFYDKDDNLTLTLVSQSYEGKRYEGRFYHVKCTSKVKTYKTPKYIMEKELPVMQDLGCIDCDDSVYDFDNGVYLKCSKCGKKVKEIEYDGTYYPEYCNRAEARKIRRYQELVNGKA